MALSAQQLEKPDIQEFIASFSGDHRFILDYYFDCDPLPNPIQFSSEIAYYDGLLGRPSVWAYSTFGLSTKFNSSESLAFIPGIYYQITMDDEILRDGKDTNIFYGMVSMRYTF